MVWEKVAAVPGVDDEISLGDRSSVRRADGADHVLLEVLRLFHFLFVSLSTWSLDRSIGYTVPAHADHSNRRAQIRPV
jgi:hypothetical protein